MKQSLVSVIVPIYNTADYLERCLDSITRQTYPNIEILLIDDGSTDTCPELCEEWVQKDRRIKVIHKSNEGLGMARNTGIEYASGEYLCFFDSDDYIDLQTIEKSCGLALRTKADVVCFGYHRVSGHGRVIRTFIPNTPKTEYQGTEIQTFFLPELIQSDPNRKVRTNLTMSAWASLYSKKLIDEAGWRFVSERQIISEDYYSLLYLYKHVKKAAVLPEACYFYCENQGSLTNTYKKDRYEKICVYYREALNVCRTLGYGPEVEKRLSYTYFSNVFLAMKQIMASRCPDGEKAQMIKNMIQDELCQRILREIRGDRLPFTWRLYLTAMEKKNTGLCCFLLRMQNLRRSLMKRRVL